MTLFKIISCSILLIVIIWLSIDHVKATYFSKKKKNKAGTGDENSLENDADVIVENAEVKLPSVGENSNFPRNADTEIINNQDNISIQNNSRPPTDGVKINEPQTMDALIKKASKLHVFTALTFLILFFILIGWYSLTTSNDNPDGNLFLVFLACCMLLYFIIRIKELIYFNSSFGNDSNHLINWTYPNGDKILLTRWGLINYHTTLPELSTSVKFEGFKWEFDNAKDFAEAVMKQEGNPLIALLPSIAISTNSNRVDEYIPFNFNDKVDITFIEMDRGLMVINVKKKSSGCSLTYPLPPDKKSLRKEVDNFDLKIQNGPTPVRAVYIEKSLVDKIMREKNPDDQALIE